MFRWRGNSDFRKRRVLCVENRITEPVEPEISGEGNGRMYKIAVIEDDALLKQALMQMLLEKSYEYGEHAGLGLIGGSVKPIAPMIGEGLKVPHIGWNRLIFPKDREKSKLFQYINEGDCVYFVHSYAGADCDAFVSARTEYGAELTAAVERGNVYGTQFHPEKSGEVGLQILKAFCEL